MVIDFANQIADAGQFSNKEFATTVWTLYLSLVTPISSTFESGKCCTKSTNLLLVGLISVGVYLKLVRMAITLTPG